MTSPTAPMVSGVRNWPGLRTEYAWMPVHGRPTTTGRDQIGIAFSGHQRLVYETAGRTEQADHAPGVTIVTGADPVTWLRVHEPVEALEMYPDPALVTGTAAARSGSGDIPPRIGASDGTVLAIGSALRRAHSAGLTDVAASTLAHRLVDHLLDRYAGLPEPDRLARAGRLDAATVDRVAQLVEASLGGPLDLAGLAAVARLSHFTSTAVSAPAPAWPRTRSSPPGVWTGPGCWWRPPPGRSTRSPPRSASATSATSAGCSGATTACRRPPCDRREVGKIRPDHPGRPRRTVSSCLCHPPC